MNHKKSFLKPTEEENSSEFKLQVQKQLSRDSSDCSPSLQLPVGESEPKIHLGLDFAYDLGDEPEEDDDEMNNTDGEEGEEEQDDILIVEGEDEDLDENDEEETSPNIRGKSANNIRSASNCSSGDKDTVSRTNLAQTNKSLNVS